MANKTDLVIVESPSKAKTIGKYLGPGYEVKASMGHVRDLPKARLSVDVKDHFKPKYSIIKGKEKLVKELKEAEEIRKEYSANVSHELNTPLMSISGYAELMMNGMVPADHVQEFSGRIYHEAVRLSNLVADIIQLSRLDESNSEVPFEEVDLYELAEDVQNNLRHPAEKKNISLELTGSSEKIQGVRHVLYEMFFNIADNAVRYTEQNGHVRIMVGSRKGNPINCGVDD